VLVKGVVQPTSDKISARTSRSSGGVLSRVPRYVLIVTTTACKRVGRTVVIRVLSSGFPFFEAYFRVCLKVMCGLPGHTD
jgi:hypothetical protein